MREACVDQIAIDGVIYICAREDGHPGMHISEEKAAWSPGMGLPSEAVTGDQAQWIRDLARRDERIPWSAQRITIEREARRRRFEVYQGLLDLCEHDEEMHTLIEELEELEAYPLRFPYLGSACWSVEEADGSFTAVRTEPDTGEQLILCQGTRPLCAAYLEWITEDAPF